MDFGKTTTQFVLPKPCIGREQSDDRGEYVNYRWYSLTNMGAALSNWPTFNSIDFCIG